MSKLLQAAKVFMRACVRSVGIEPAGGRAARRSGPQLRAAHTAGFARLAWAPVALLAAGAALAPQTALAQTPTVTGLSPTSGPTGGTTSVILTGTNFTGTTGVAGVKFGATNATSYTVNNNTQITAVAPAGSAGTVNVTVTNAGNTSATGAANQYTYVAAPVAGSFSYGSIVAYNEGSNQTTSLDLSNYLTGGGTPTSYAVGSATTAQGGSVSVNASGIATYTPPVGYRNGNDSFTWSATNSGGTSSFATLTITIGNPTFSVTLPSSTATVGTAYNTGAVAVTVDGGRATYTINSISGLPAGLSDAGGGVITGTPSATASVTVTVNITDSSFGAGPYTADATASLVVSAAPSPVVSSFTASAVAYNSTNNGLSVAGYATNSPTSYAVGSATTAQGGSVSVDNAGLVTYSAPTGFRGNDSFTFTATNNGGTSAPATVTVPVSNPTLSLSLTGSGTRGAALSGVFLSATGGQAPYSCSTTLASGALPSGVSLNADCSLSGTPAASGTFNFTASFTDSSAGTGPMSATSGTLTLSIAAPTVTMTPASGALPGATAGTAYSQSFTASGGTSPYSYARTGGTLPAGLTLSGATLSGTPTAVGTFNFDITATDSSTAGSGGPYTTTRSYSVTVSAPVITLSALSNGTVGTAYTPTVTASGGTASYSYSVTSGSLPAGVSLSTGGVFSGTPSAGGTFNFTITTTDSTTGPGAPYSGSQSYTLSFSAPTITLSPVSLTGATAGTAYSGSITAAGGTGGYSYAVTSGSLPAGLTLSGGGALSGTPTAAGSFTFTVTATDSSTGVGPYTGSRSYTLTVAAPTIVVSPTSLPNGRAGTAYSQTVTASGGVGGYSYAVTGGALPPGWSLSSGGVLSGTATASDTYNFTITATDSATGTGAPFTGSRGYSVDVLPPNFTLTPPTLSATVGQSYTGNFVAGGGTAPYTYTRAAGTLPPGLTLGTDGTLSGTPTGGGSWNFTVIARDSTGGPAAPFQVGSGYTFTVSAATLALAPSILSNGTVGSAYSASVTTSGGTAPYTYQVTAGALPAGMTLSSGGVLSGTPTAGGSFNFTVTATDSSTGAGAPFTTGRAYALTINAPTLTLTAALPDGAYGVAYSQTLAASGGTAPYSYQVTAGALPTGLTLSSGGTLSGAPTVFGSFNFSVTATDSSTGSGPFTGTQAYALTLAPPSAPTVAAVSANVAYGSTGQAISLSPSGVYASLAVGTAPAHGTVSINGTTATYTPTSTYYGADSFTYTATGPGGTSAPAAVTITVGTPPAPVAADLGGVTVAYGSTGQAIDLSGSITGVHSNLSVATAPAHGTITVSGDVATYTPAAAYYGADSFTYTATGPGGTSAPATVSLTVATPGAPTASAVSANVAYNSSGQAISLSASGLYSALTVGTAPAHGTVSISGTTATYTPTSGYFGADSFTYVATGPGGTSAPATVSLTVGAPGAPTVAAVSASVPYNSTGQAISLSASGVYSTLAVGTAPAHGTVSISGTTATYTPTSGYFGADSFTYVATGPGGTSAPATVSLTVTTPAAPTVTAVSADVAYNSTGQTIGLSPSGVYSTLAVGTTPAHGTVSISGTTATYVPTEDYFGADSFTYVATGPGGTSSPATVSLTVAAPPPPVVTPPPPVTTSPTSPGGSISVDLPTTTSGEVTGYRITVGGVHGTAEIETVSSGAFAAMLQASAIPIYRLKYTPAANFMGTDTVTLVAVGPGGDSAPAVFTFQVLGKAPNLTAQVLSNTSVTLRPTQTLTGGPFQALRITRQPAFGTATVQGLTIVFTPGVQNGGATSLDYVIDLPFGSSAAGRIDLTTNAAPSAQTLTARTPAGRPVTVRITDGALGGPFTGAAVTGITPAGSATATLVQGGTTAAPTWDLTVTPQGTFTGNTVIGFTLTNAFATTAGTLTVTVDPRPDPSLDPDVRGVISSQVESARRFADAQTDNFNRRLEQIRQGGAGDSNMLSVNAGFAMDGSQGDPNAQLRQRLGGARQAFGDESLRARLGLLDDERGGLFGRDSVAVPTGWRDASTDRLGAAPSSTGAGDGKPSLIGVWAAGGIDWGRRDAETGTRDYRFSTSGVSAGSDMRISDDLVIGVGVGYGFDRTKVGDAGSRSEGRSVVVAAYGGWRLSPSVSLDGVLGYGDLNYDSRRWATAANAGAGGYAFGDRKGDMTFGSLSLVWDHKQGGANRSIYGRVQAQSVTLDGFTETGADIYALTYEALDFDSLSSTLGLRYDWRIEQRNGYFRPAVRLEWTHAFDHAGPQTVAYADWLTSPRYGVALDGWDRDTVEAGVEGDWKIGDSLNLSVLYRAAMGADTTSQGLQFKLMTRF